MATKGGKFAQLGGDDVIRFLDLAHFLDELDGNLGRGRAIVRSRRPFEQGQRLSVAVEAPGADEQVECEARIVVVRDGFVGLELLDFERVREELDALADAAEAADAEPEVPAEKTVIAPMPGLGPEPGLPELLSAARPAPEPPTPAPPTPEPPAPEPEDPAEPERETNDLPDDRAQTSPAPRPAPRRRRPRPVPHDPPTEAAAPARREPARHAPHRRPEPIRSSADEVEPVPPPPAQTIPEPIQPPAASVTEPEPSRPPEPERASSSEPVERTSSLADIPGPTFGADALTDPAGSLADAADEHTQQGLQALTPPRTPPPGTGPVPRPRSTSALVSPLQGEAPPMLEAAELVLVREGTLVRKNPLDTPVQVQTTPPPEAATAIADLEGEAVSPATITTPSVEPPPDVPTAVAVDADLGLSPPPQIEDIEPDEPEPAVRAGPDAPTTDEGADFDAPERPSTVAEPPPEIEATSAELSAELEVPPLPDDIDDLELDGEAAPELPPPSADDLVLAPPPDLDEETETADEAADAVVAPPPPPAPPPEPATPVANIEALEDKHPSVPRVTRGGVLRVADAATLLGLYLAQVRHGRLTVYGPLEGEPGDEVALKVVGVSVVSLPCKLTARVGDWWTLEVPDPSVMQDVLRDAVDDWKSELPAEVGASAPAVAPAAPAVVLTPAAPPAAAIVPPAPEPEPEPAAPPPEPEPEPAPPPPEPEPEDDGPPEVPSLAGDRVVFRRRKDLAHEIETNLRNGGLFVEAPPLPIRTKRQLVVQVGGTSWGVELQADVVFADGGRLGFSIMGAHDAVAKLEARLAGPEPAPAPSSPPAMSSDELPSSRPPAPSSDGDTRSLFADGEAYIGSLQKPLTDAALLRLPDKRIEDLSSVMRTSSLQLVEHAVSHRWKGVLKLECKGHETTTWFHEGSVAFVLDKPHDEAHSIGRILINQKKLNEAGLREALEAARASKKSLGRALVALGQIKKSDLSGALREQMRLKLDEALAYDSGNFEWTPWREPPGDADLVLTKGIGILAHHIRHRFEAMNVNELEGLFGKNLARPVGHDDDLDQSTQGMHLQPKEIRFLQLQVDGRSTIQDAVRGSPVGRLASLRLVGLGLALGVLHFTVGGRAPREATRVGAPPTRHDALTKELKDTLHLLQGMNHFEVLGVHWSAHYRSFKEAYDKAKKQHAPNARELGDAPKEAKELAKRIAHRIDEAFDHLKDATKRVGYRKQLFDATERQYAADMLVKQGEVALMRGDRMGAMEALETAVELDPNKRNRQLLTTAREGRR